MTSNLEFCAIAAYSAFAQSSADRIGEMPPWGALPADVQADWRAVADAVRMAIEIRADHGQRAWVVGPDEPVS